MGRPKGNGLVELVDEKGSRDSGFFCMDLVGHLKEEGVTDWEKFHRAFIEAESGRCPYLALCERGRKTMERREREGIQMTFNFN